MVQTPGAGIDNKTAEMGLLDILKTDKNFDIDFFLDGAKDAFVMIVEAFAEGDREMLKELLAPEVYKAFEGAISDREARNESQITDIHAIRKADVIAARTEDKKAFITVKFVADETSVTRDKNDVVTHGHPERITQMKDIWTFGRSMKSKDPSWLVYETRGDFEDDNDILPNTH